jgi:hypothetical protein
MTKQQMVEALDITGAQGVTVKYTDETGEEVIIELSPETVKSTIEGRIWRSTGVNKNKRESQGGGVKAVIAYAIENELITSDEALQIMLVGNTEKVKELKSQMPNVEKGEHPIEADLLKALEQTKSNRGQA